jgi:hypothetical protein
VATFTPNTVYKRAQIQAILGGELRSYLPQKNYVILAGCFAVNKMNPDAPFEIQAGNAPKVARKADLLASQPQTVFPVFLRKSKRSSDYFYVGEFACAGQSKLRRDIARAEAKSGRANELSCLLFLKAKSKVYEPVF